MVNYGGGANAFSRLQDFQLTHSSVNLFFWCTDEVSALVVDIGTSSLRAGYAGDDTPRAIIPTAYGYHKPPPDIDVPMGGDTTENGGDAVVRPKFSKIYVGSSGPSIWREGMEVGNPLLDGLSM